MRWYGTVLGHSHLPGSNATKRMFSDRSAVEHVLKAYSAVVDWWQDASVADHSAAAGPGDATGCQGRDDTTGEQP